WMVNYAPHMPRGSEHKLFSVDPNLQMTVHPESVGGTPAGRMIHRESDQLLMAHYAIDRQGNVRAISPEVMPARVTAFARHLTDPENLVYVIDMEGMIYELNVHTLQSTLLFKKPVPGWHGKGGYTSQGRLVVSNNGEHAAGKLDGLQVGGPARNEDEAGVLAEWDGSTWKIVERKQFTDVTGPGGILGNDSQDDRLWAIGWDRRSLRLKLLQDGVWSTFLLPKATHNNDPIHGWYTEWPRIRQVSSDRWMMDMHGMFFDFPPAFSKQNSAGLRPISSHLRYIPDFCEWNGQLVLATDETSIQGNTLAGQPQSNLWFGQLNQLTDWGPRSAYGGPWVGDSVKAGAPSDPFLIAGFPRRTLHLAVGRSRRQKASTAVLRATDQQVIHEWPEQLASLPRITVPRGDWHRPAPGFEFSLSAPATVFLAVDQRGEPTLPKEWQRTSMTIVWGQNHQDRVYRRDFDAGMVKVPGNQVEHVSGSFGMPHMAMVASQSVDCQIMPTAPASMVMTSSVSPEASKAQSVTFSLEVDRTGNGQWSLHSEVTVDDGYATVHLPQTLQAEWIRLTPSVDCLATAYLHLTDDRFHSADGTNSLFAGLADVDEPADAVHSALLYAAKKNRNLQILTSNGDSLQFTKDEFEFVDDEDAPKLRKLLAVEPEFRVDERSVVLEHGGRTLRLPKGNPKFDQPFAAGWPRGSREVESERHLANFHGTFYEVPLIENGRTPAFDLLRPVASHNKQIADFCTWNGLLVLSGVKRQSDSAGPHVWSNSDKDCAVWFGAIDDLWQLGKPRGEGGPWKDTSVKAGQPSDAYLMTGYDRKTLTVSADQDATFTIEVDVDHQTGWHKYRQVTAPAGVPQTLELPEDFSVHWVRFVSDVDCTATAWLKYE
ncbi:MAG: hypothetical protein KDA81_11080, partial [Planctomycetaceae bacterium]|nr:hypothetical protein [Planctomycetaceae bacterium]